MLFMCYSHMSSDPMPFLGCTLLQVVVMATFFLLKTALIPLSEYPNILRYPDHLGTVLGSSEYFRISGYSDKRCAVWMCHSSTDCPGMARVSQDLEILWQTWTVWFAHVFTLVQSWDGQSISGLMPWCGTPHIQISVPLNAVTENTQYM